MSKEEVAKQNKCKCNNFEAFTVKDELFHFLNQNSSIQIFNELNITPTLFNSQMASKAILFNLLAIYTHKQGLSNVYYSSRNLKYLSMFLLAYLEVDRNEYENVSTEDLESIVDNNADKLPSDLTSNERNILLTFAKGKVPTVKHSQECLTSGRG